MAFAYRVAKLKLFASISATDAIAPKRYLQFYRKSGTLYKNIDKMKTKKLSAENIIKLIIAEQIVIFKEMKDFKKVEDRLNMLSLHSIK